MTEATGGSAAAADEQVERRAWWSGIGPGVLVTASFVGPGTVTTATLAGADFGFALMWAALFSVLATMVLQEMAARVGLVSGAGLGTAIRTTLKGRVPRLVLIVLVVSALGIGSAVYARGDLVGTALGLNELTGVPVEVWPAISFVVVALLLATGRYRVIERALMVLVGVMGLVFLVTAVIVRPDVGELFRGSLVPTIPSGAALVVIGLIGTTVVPYNLFLHSSSVVERYRQEPDGPARAAQAGLRTEPVRSPRLRQSMRLARTDTFVSIGIGGLITLAIIATAAAAFFARGIAVEDAAGMASQLEPLLGPLARYFFAIGLFSAGLTSAMAGGLAAAFAVSTTLGWGQDLRSWRFRGIWFVVLLYGAIAASTGANPVATILFAQVTNGLLLPILVVTLLLVMNRRDLLGEYRNGTVQNVLGGIVAVVVTGLAAYSLLGVFGVI